MYLARFISTAKKHVYVFTSLTKQIEMPSVCKLNSSIIDIATDRDYVFSLVAHSAMVIMVCLIDLTSSLPDAPASLQVHKENKTQDLSEILTHTLIPH